MRGKILLTIIIVLAFAGSFVGQWLMTRSGNNAKADRHAEPERIVSMSPSVTEALFELGLGDRVVGVTTFCDYPQEARKIKKIGGYLDPNYEAIVRLGPDLVILREEHADAREHLRDLRIRTITVDHTTIDGILDSFSVIGKPCGAESRAREIVADLKDRMSGVREKAAGSERPKVMICVEREMGSGVISNVYAVGSDGFYDELIRIAGGTPAFAETKTAFPRITAEGILRADPDIIIDMISDIEERGLDMDAVAKDWETLSEVTAVKNKRVHVFTQDFMVIPGPRFILILEELAKTINPQMEQE